LAISRDSNIGTGKSVGPGRNSIGALIVAIIVVAGGIIFIKFYSFREQGREPGKYVNKAQGFSIDFPPDWEVREGEMGLDVIALSPPEGPSDQFRENVSVASSPMSTPLSADAILDANIPNMIKVITDFKPAERSYVELGGIKAARLNYTQRQGLSRLAITLYAVPGKSRAYLLYCTAETSAAARFQERFDKIVKNFKAEK
jgi:hypothetical protein